MTGVGSLRPLYRLQHVRDIGAVTREGTAKSDPSAHIADFATANSGADLRCASEI